MPHPYMYLVFRVRRVCVDCRGLFACPGLLFRGCVLRKESILNDFSGIPEGQRPVEAEACEYCISVVQDTFKEKGYTNVMVRHFSERTAEIYGEYKDKIGGVCIRVQGFGSWRCVGLIEVARHPANSQFYCNGDREADMESLRLIMKVSDIQLNSLVPSKGKSDG